MYKLKYTKEFETGLASYLGVPFCSLVNSGSSANLLAIAALTSPLLKERQLKKGDEIIKEYPLISPGEVRKITFLDVVEEFFSSLVKNDKE